MRQLDFTQISVLTAPYLHHTLEYALDSIAANGFRGVELWGASPHFCIDDYTPEQRAARIREIRQMLKDRDLRLSAFQPEQCRQYPINIASPIAYVRERSIQFMEQYLEDTLELGTDRMILAPGWGYVDAPEEDAFARAVEAIQRIAEKAEKLGVKLSIEEMDPLSTLLVRDLPHLKKLLDAVESPVISACLDTFIAADNREAVEQYYEAFGQIGHVHFSDYGSEGYMVPGTGDIVSGKNSSVDVSGGAAAESAARAVDAESASPAEQQGVKTVLERQLETLAAHDYDGDLVLGLWGAGYYKDPDAALRQSIQWAKACELIRK